MEKASESLDQRPPYDTVSWHVYTRKEIGIAYLVDDWKTLLDVTSLSHSDNATIVTHVEDAVLLEDGTEHGLDFDAGAGAADEAALLVQSLGEEIDTKVSVLASGTAGGDADDLAWTALQDQEVADADVMAGDGDGVGNIAAWCGWCRSRRALGDNVILATAVWTVDGMHDVACGVVESVTEAVVLSVFVVISHALLALRWGRFDESFVDTDLFLGVPRTVLRLRSVLGLGSELRGVWRSLLRSLGSVLWGVNRSVVGWLVTGTVVAFGGVDGGLVCVSAAVRLLYWDLRGVVLVMGWAVRKFNVDLGVGVLGWSRERPCQR